MSYTQEQLDTMAELGVLSQRILNMDMPHDVKSRKTIAEARRLAATYLHEMGYSHRQIMGALGLKSPQSVSVYLNAPNKVKTGGVDNG